MKGKDIWYMIVVIMVAFLYFDYIGPKPHVVALVMIGIVIVLVSIYLERKNTIAAIRWIRRQQITHVVQALIVTLVVLFKNQQEGSNMPLWWIILGLSIGIVLYCKRREFEELFFLFKKRFFS